MTQRRIPKNADTEKVLDDMVEKLGLNAELVTIQATRSRNKDIHSYAYLTRDKIGGNIHYPDFGIPLDDVDADTRADDFTTSVSFTWTRTDKFTQKHVIRQQYKQAFETNFVIRAEARKVASNRRIAYILWPRERSGEREMDTSLARSQSLSPLRMLISFGSRVIMNPSKKMHSMILLAVEEGESVSLVLMMEIYFGTE